MKAFGGSKEVSHVLIDFLAEISLVNCTAKNIGCLIKKLKYCPKENKKAQGEFSTNILNLFLKIIEKTMPIEVFSFSGEPFSGLEIAQLNKRIPKEGFGFFGWIRFSGRSIYTIFKFMSLKGSEIELYLKENVIYYSVNNLSLNKA